LQLAPETVQRIPQMCSASSPSTLQSARRGADQQPSFAAYGEGFGDRVVVAAIPITYRITQ